MPRQRISLEEYQAKVINDNGLNRAKVPSPLLRDMKVKAGEYLTFRLSGTKEATMKISKAKKAIKKKKV